MVGRRKDEGRKNKPRGGGESDGAEVVDSLSACGGDMKNGRKMKG